MKQIFTKLFSRMTLISLLFTFSTIAAWSEEVTFVFGDLASSNNWSNGVAYTPVEITPITLSAVGGGNNAKYYTSDKSWRMYNGGTVNIVPTEGYKITAVTSAPSQTFTINNGSASLSCSATIKFTSITVTYTTIGSSPSFSADNVDIAYNATSGSITYSINNSVEGGVVSAAVTEGNWLTLGSGTASPISFTCSANAGTTARTATVTLTYSYNTNQTITKTITVTQTANPNAVDNISDITAAATYTIKGTIVAKSQRGFIVGDGTGYVYYYNQNYAQSDFSIGDKVKLTGSVVDYGGVFEFNNTATVTSVTESNYVAEDPTVLTGAEMDSRVGSTAAQLSSFVQYEGVLSVSGNYYNVTSIDGATTAQGSLSFPIDTQFSTLNGKKVKVTGYYVGVSSSRYYNTMLGSVEEIAVPVITANNITLDYDATSGEIPYSIANPTTGVTLVATTTADWISNINVAADKVTFTMTANNGTADRTATITLSYTGATNKVVTVTQGHYVAEFATLPFTFDGGKEDLANTAGLTQNDLGSDYNNSPKLKFDTSGDWVLLRFNERPGVLSFDMKGNPGGNPSTWSGTFTVLSSEDGSTFTEVASYDDLTSTVQSVEIDNLGESVRYIKWVYTKTSGNVAFGNIALGEYVAPEPSITVAPATVNHVASDVEGTLNIAYESLSINDAEDFDIVFYDTDGNTMGEPDWIVVEVAEQDPSVGTGYVVSYIMDENTGDARTASFELKASNDEGVSVFSNRVTITQAKYVAPGDEKMYSLFTGELEEGDYIIYYDGKAMNNTIDNDRLQYEEVTPVNNTITTDNAALVWHIAKSGDYWTIYSADANAFAAGTGAKNKAQMVVDGTDDKALWTVSGSETYEFVNKANSTAGVNSNLRNNGSYGFACYATSTGGALSLYKLLTPSAPDTYELNLAAGDGGYWGTFYNGVAGYVLPEGAQAFTMNAEKKLYRLGDDNAKGRYIPAGMAVVIIADVYEITLNKGESPEAVSVNGGANILQGSDYPVAKNGKQNVLGKKDGAIGFFKFTGTNIPANKAFYVISE